MKRFAQWCVFFSAVLLCSQGAWAADSTMLPIERRMLFNAWIFLPQGSYYAANWTHDGPAPSSFPAGRRALLSGTNHVHTSVSGNVTNIWKLTACRTGTSAQLSTTANFISPKDYVYPALPTNWQASLQNTLDAMIETPYYPEGIGTVYFESINVSPADPTEITVEIATNMLEYVYLGGLPTNVMHESEGPNGDFVYSNNWQTLSVFTNNAAFSNDFTRYQKTLNYRQAARLRVRRTGTIAAGYGSNLDNAFTAIDNICISYPPSDVVIRKTEAVFQPGYPSVSTNISIRCYVDNFGTNNYELTTYLKRTVKAVYRWRYLDQVVGAWQTNVMPYVSGTGDGQGNGERYEVALPAQSQVGDLEYYFICDFDGYRYKHTDYTQTGYTYLTEWLSPKTFRGGASQPDGREFYARLRPFYSRFGGVSVVTDQHAEPIAMTLVGDELWRGMVPLNNGITNLAWRFQGVSEYVSGADDFSTNLVCWTEQAQAGTGVMPCGGKCVATNAASLIRVLVDGGGYVQLLFNTDTLEYLASRAEYQNFNAWPAPPDKFTESSGQGSKQRFLNTFDVWPTNVSVVKDEFFCSAPPSINVYSREPFITLNGWLTGGSAYVLDRLAGDVYNRPYGVTSFRNVALRLKGADAAIGLGYVHNRVETRTDGVREISFKCRLGQSADRFTASYYKLGFANQNYLVRAQGGADAGMSPEAPTMSLLGYYNDPDNFYEFRMNQVTNPANLTVTGDKRINFQLFKWSGGTSYLLKENRLNVDAVLTTPSLIEMRLYNSGSTTQIRCKFATSDNILSYDDNGTIGGPAIQSGTIGFLSQECRSGFSAVRTNPTTSGAVEVGSDATATFLLDSTSYATQILNWYTPAGYFEGRGDYAMKGIYAVIPTQKLGVYLQASSDDSATPPSMPGTVDWKLFKEISLSGFSYSTNAVVFNQWRSHFVMLQVMGRSDSLKIDVAIDELRVSSWRGQESSDSGLAGDAGWAATEAWVVTNSAALGNVVQLDHTRADPAEDQAIRSPLLSNGMGMLEFDYQVLRPPAKITVQYAFDYDSSNWRPLRSLIVSNAMPAFVHELFYLGTNATGYLRVLNERVGGYTNALVEINNATAWDEPDVDDSAWRGYNVKITDTDRARIMLDESKACFLNNSQTAETDPQQTLHPEAYVKSPRLRWGLGSLSFMARAYTNTQSAAVSLYATTSADGPAAPDGQWFSITNYTISSTLYATYTFKPTDGRLYTAVKLAVATIPAGGTGRVCLEEVVISEPVFAWFEIQNVKVLCNEYSGEYSATRFQPLVSDRVGVEAQITNIRLSPQNIQMYVTYYVGTNVWGVYNWPSGQTVTKPMVPIVGNLYRTLPTDDIPAQEADQVVQYYVWATYQDDGGVALEQRQTKFDIPPWYYPVDLNQAYHASGWSSYYVVYGVPVGSVWINEINAVDSATNGTHHVGENQYIEIAVPADVDLTGWQVDLVDYLGDLRTIEITNAPPQVAVTNGYAFFVIGEHALSRDPSVPPLPKMDLGVYGLYYSMPAILPGGIRLRRPLGMYEHTVAYDWDPTIPGFSGADWAAEDPEGKFVYVGIEDHGGSLNVTNTPAFSVPTADDWIFPMSWTPGLQNEGQAVPEATGTLQGIERVATPVLTPPSGTLASISLDVTAACATEGATIHYTLDGSEPTSASAAYTGPITLSVRGFATVKAKAFMSGMLSSGTAVAFYTVETPGFDITGVRILCRSGDTYSDIRRQPLASDNVGVEARIANERMSPSNIEMFVSYYVGTNVWGVNNWPTGQTVTKPMYPKEGSPDVYRTSALNDIPAQSKDQVVQYRVWASFLYGTPRQEFQKTTDDSPFIYPVDLNFQYVDQGWSPYYIVYGSLAQMGDISKIYSATPATTVRTAGSIVDIRFRLRSTAVNGYFTRQYLGGLPIEVADILSPFRIRVMTGNGYAYANLVGVDNLAGPAYTTELRFQYTVRPGDLALPMRLYGTAGAASPDEDLDVFQNWQWRIYNSVTTSNVVWRYTVPPLMDGPPDPTFVFQNIRLQTLDFETASWSVSATETLISKVTSGSPVSNEVPFYVWSGDTNIAQIVEQQAGQSLTPLKLLAGASEATFHIYGKAMGTTLIYLSPEPAPGVGMINYITKQVTVTAPPPSIVSISLPGMDAQGSVTLDESDSPINSLTVTLSEAYASDVTVRLDTVPAVQTNVTFTGSPMYVTVPAGTKTSAAIGYSASDGTSASKTTGVRISPVIENVAASNKYTISESALVKVLNVAPVIVSPLANVTMVVDTLKTVAYDWEVTDVAADVLTGMTVTWDFGDGSLAQTVSGASGTINHMYVNASTYTVTVTAKDKDGTSAPPVSFFVEVKDALPVPYVQVVMSSAGYNETNGIGSLYFSLSKKFPEDTWIQLSVEPAGQSNLVFGALPPIPIYANETNSASLEFVIRDGTELSRLTGLTFIPAVVSNDVAKAYFTSRTLCGVKVYNEPPLVTRVLDMKVNALTNIVFPAGIFKAFSFEVADVNADLIPVLTRWNFGDGTGDFTATAVTNRKGSARGVLSHTYQSPGTYLVWMQAEDKDGGFSQEVEFVVTVGQPPTVRILPPSGPLSETPNTGEKDFIVVQLTSAFTNAVTVHLDVTPATNYLNGVLILETPDVVFPGGNIGEVKEQKVYIASNKDGTDVSAGAGFKIMPVVTSTAAAQIFYGANLVSANVRIANVSPVIITPASSPITGDVVAYTVPQGADWTYFWSVSDVTADITSLNHWVTLTWYWGDGTTSTVDTRAGRAGSIIHNYSSVGDMVIQVVAEDKDGGQAVAQFKVRATQATVPVPIWWLDQFPTLMSMAGGNYQIAPLMDVDLDGMLTWEEYVAGSIPTNNESVFRARIAVSNGYPRITWSPDLGTARVYVVNGRTNLMGEAWGPTNSGNRFFRVKVQMP